MNVNISRTLKHSLFISIRCLLLVCLWLSSEMALCSDNHSKSKREDLSPLLETIRLKYQLPALAAAIVSEGKTTALGAVGVRKEGTEAKVASDDLFFLGSCTKAMTSTVIAILIEQGKLKWETTLEEALPDLFPEMHPECKKITIKQLLSHYSGLPTYHGEIPKGMTWDEFIRFQGTLQEQRKQYARLMLKQPPEIKPGERYSYSNVGYVLAGVVAETVTDTPWEELMEQWLFKPLGMATATFELSGSEETIDQPWQHGYRTPMKPFHKSENKMIAAPELEGANIPILGPAGTALRCSIGDWAKFIIAHLKGIKEENSPLQLKDFHVLHTPPFGGDYALGWVVAERPWGAGRVLWHSGSNLLNKAVVWMAPRLDFAVLVMTNQGDEEAEKATDELAGLLIRKFHSENMTGLDNLNWSPKSLALLGCVKGCLDYLKIPVSDAWLFGGIGYAFIMNIHERVLSSSVGGWNNEMISELGKNLGYETETIWGQEAQPDFQQKQKLAWDRVREAIDNGYPCYGFPLCSIPEWHLIYGYDQWGYHYKGVVDESGSGPKLWNELGTMDGGYFEIHIIEPCQSSLDHKTVKDALRFALELAQNPSKWIYPHSRAGLAGYENWIKALEQGRADAFGTAFNALVWSECRRYAVEFLKEAKNRLANHLSPLFEEAIVHYSVVSENLDRVSEAFPCFSVSGEQREINVKDKARCVKAIHYLKAAQEAEAAGLKALENIADILK